MSAGQKALPILSIIFFVLGYLFCVICTGMLNVSAIMIFCVFGIAFILTSFILSIIGIVKSKGSKFCLITSIITLVLSILIILGNIIKAMIMMASIV